MAQHDRAARPDASSDEHFDFVIVGSGAGGGPLAANLAEAGWRVLLLEAGSDHQCPYYDVPIMHARASEDADMRWDFFVRHYRDEAKQKRDSKFVPGKDGVWYPRGATLGGSTAISALVTVYPHHSDWDTIADLTGDRSWRADAMRAYFERLEHWHGPDVTGAPTAPGDASRHGREGWLQTARADPRIAGREPWFLKIIDAVEQTSRATVPVPDDTVLPNDPNDWRVVSERREGMAFLPVAVGRGMRNGARERVLAVMQRHPDRLVLRLDALATRVLFAEHSPRRAIGVEYLEGAHLYRADPRADAEAGGARRRRVYATREVILSGGAFNTPQLLKLSGIGPADELRRHGIEVRVDLPGVGENLQDRYEVSVISRLSGDYPVFDGAVFDCPADGERGDPLFQEWAQARDGPYGTNGSLAGLIKRSSVAGVEPDLFVFALPVHFRGYFPGYADEGARFHDRLSVLVLKAHTGNRAGRVTLRSADPRDPPEIAFNYFEDGDLAAAGDDLHATIDGVELARQIAARLGGLVAEEVQPGPQAKTRADLARFVHDEAWGHHASCTCRIGAEDDPRAVLDGDFRVRGVEGLRVVDASVFPVIPGFFIASAVYMVSEKASDAILRDMAARG